MRPRRGLPRRSCRLEHNQSHSLFYCPKPWALPHLEVQITFGYSFPLSTEFCKSLCKIRIFPDRGVSFREVAQIALVTVRLRKRVHASFVFIELEINYSH